MIIKSEKLIYGEKPSLPNYTQDHKADSGKTDYTLLSVPFLEKMAEVRMFGVVRYKERDSWKKVEPERFKQALMRHCMEYINGKEINLEDGGVSVLAQIAVNAQFLYDLSKEEVKR